MRNRAEINLLFPRKGEVWFYGCLDRLSSVANIQTSNMKRFTILSLLHLSSCDKIITNRSWSPVLEIIKLIQPSIRIIQISDGLLTLENFFSKKNNRYKGLYVDTFDESLLFNDDGVARQSSSTLYDINAVEVPVGKIEFETGVFIIGRDPILNSSIAEIIESIQKFISKHSHMSFKISAPNTKLAKKIINKSGLHEVDWSTTHPYSTLLILGPSTFSIIKGLEGYVCLEMDCYKNSIFKAKPNFNSRKNYFRIYSKAKVITLDLQREGQATLEVLDKHLLFRYFLGDLRELALGVIRNIK